jgi:hypothetical protein
LNTSVPTMRTMPRLTNRVGPHVCGIRDALSLQLPIQKFRKDGWGEDVLAPPMGSQCLPWWAWGPLSVPCRPDTPAYKLQIKTRSRSCIHAMSCVLQLRTLPPCRDGLRCCHVSYSSEPHLPVEMGSGAITCPTTLDLASRPRWDMVPPCVLWLQTTPPYRGELRRCHMSHGIGPHLPEGEGSGAAMHLAALCGLRASSIKRA